jgi:putative redox protein
MAKTLPYTFKNYEGKELSGKLEMPDQTPKAFVIFVHCFTGNKDFSANRRISRTLRDHGFAVLRFDFTGLGSSAGDFSETNFSSNLIDLKNAYDQITQEYSAPQILIGHSLGGAAVLTMAPELKELKAVITIGAPSSTQHLTHLFEDHIDTIEEHGQSEVEIGGRPFTIKKQFLDDIRGHQVLDKVKKMRRPLLIFHSPEDETVEIENAKEIYVNARHPKSFISLSGADHLLTKAQDTKYVANVIASWCDRYIVDEGALEHPEDAPVDIKKIS